MSSWGLSQHVLANLIASGVRDFVLCPGSRNTPLSLTLVRCAREGLVNLHRRMDERAAGFLGLGVAKVTGVCALVVTSGSAVGNLLPAVMEAHASGVCLIVISADRPATLQASRSNQTTSQSGIFGAHCVHTANLYSNDDSPAAWASQTRRAVVAGLGLRTCRPGPVQINLGLDTPLTPEEGPGLAALVASADFSLPASRDPHLEDLEYVPGTVVLAADASADVGAAAAQVAEKACLPLLAEPSSNARHSSNAIWNYVPQLASGRIDEINRVLVYGHPTLSRSVAKLLSSADQVIAVGQFADWPDPGLTVTGVVDAVRVEPDKSDWLCSWQSPEPQPERELSGTSAVAQFLSHAGQNIFFGSSNSIRYADNCANWPKGTCYANRGLAGIDGAIATAAGIALASGKPTSALMGDLTFLYDAGALLIPAGQPQPDLRVVVLDDDGGAIFRSLEVGAAEFADDFTQAFGMPHGHDLAEIARGYGVDAQKVATLDGLNSALSKPIDGLSVVVAAMPPVA